MRTHPLALGLLALIATGCTTYRAPRTYRIDQERTIAQTYLTTWDRVVAWLAHNGLDMRRVDKETGEIIAYGAPDGSFAQQYLDCGDAIEQVNNTRLFGRRAEVRVNLRRVGDTATSVFVLVTGTATLSSTSGSVPVTCLSNGVAERRIIASAAGEDASMIAPIVTTTAAEEEALATKHYTAWASIAVLPIGTEDFADVHVSDWQNYGTGPMEGRVALPLSRSSADGLFPGGAIGAGAIWGDVTLFGELQMAFTSEISAFNFIAGLMYAFARAGDFSFSVAPRIGFGGMSTDFGEVRMLPGKTPPVVTREGTFFVGDRIETSVFGASLQGALSTEYHFTDRLSVMLTAGYVHGIFDDMEVRSGDVVINFDSPSVVEPRIDEWGEGSSRQAGVRPDVSASGPSAGLGLRWRF